MLLPRSSCLRHDPFDIYKTRFYSFKKICGSLDSSKDTRMWIVLWKKNIITKKFGLKLEIKARPHKNSKIYHSFKFYFLMWVRGAVFSLKHCNYLSWYFKILGIFLLLIFSSPQRFKVHVISFGLYYRKFQNIKV